VVAGSIGVSVGLGAALKGDCFGSHLEFWRSRLCYNDIAPLYYDRGINHGVFPYIHATLSSGQGAHGFNEYPVLTGLFMWGVGQTTNDGSSYFVLTVCLLSLCAATSTGLLWGSVGTRALYWSASPIFVMYAFHNWDLLAVTASVAGFAAWRSERSWLAAVAFAVGGAFKLYPVLFVIPLVCDQLVSRRSRRGAIVVGATGFGCLALINAPFLINASGWWATYRFQIERTPADSGGIWYILDRTISTQTENRASFVFFAAALLVITCKPLIDRSGSSYPVVESCAAITAAFIVFNKVSSPQYMLWLLPFFAMLRLGSIWWFLLSTIAVVRYAALFGVDVLPLGLGTADRVTRAVVVAQALILIGYVVALIGRRADAAPDGDSKSFTREAAHA
jgi:uncharacterized membrane protein